jgi:hypothetical protein
MLRIANIVREIIARLFPAKTITRTIVSPLQLFDCNIIEPHRSRLVASRPVWARDEASAVALAGALLGERIQVLGGGRYRAHSNGVFTRIDRVNRRRAEDRAASRRKRGEDGNGGIDGEGSPSRVG